MSLFPLVSFRGADECTDGGRRAKGRAKSHPTTGYSSCRGAAEVFRERQDCAKNTYATQDDWEEYVPRRPVCPFSNPYDEEDELATSPVLEIRLDD